MSIYISCHHISGEKNEEADLLSRAFNTPEDWKKFQRYCDISGNSWDQVPRDLLYYPDKRNPVRYIICYLFYSINMMA